MKTTLSILMLLVLSSSFMFSELPFTPPKAQEIPVTDTVHNFVMTDYFRWLEIKEDPKVRQWSESQHNASVDYIKKNTKVIPGFRDEIQRYLDRDIKGAPFLRGEREFFSARKKGDNQSKLYTLIDGQEIMIFDPEQLDPTGKTAITGMVFTLDGERAAIGTQFQGNEISDYRIINTRTGEVMGEPITGLAGFVWRQDENFAYIYSRTQEMINNQTPVRVYLHRIGDATKRENDIFMGAPADAKNSVSYWDSREGDLTFRSEGDFYSNTLWVRPVNSNGDFKKIYESKKYKASADIRNGKMYIFTNHEAPNYRLMITDLDKPEFENWKDFYPEGETVLQGYAVTNDYVLIQYRKDVLSHLKVYDLKGNFIRDMELPEVGNLSSISYHRETNTVYASIASFTATTRMYKIDGKQLTWEFYYQDTPPIDTENITAKQVFFNSKDGTRVPMFIVHRKDMQLNGDNPTMLYGYGGFNVNQTPSFVGTTASFINRGGVYVVVNLRGGAEYGENWHQDGMLFKKQNTFDDFAYAAEYLIAEKYTNPDKIAIKGGSNGGLLIGAAVMQRPDLYKVAICAVPLLDMLRYHKFLIARFWIPEYGDPEVKEDFVNLLSYSPYHNIRKGFNYPTIMVKAGENDSRVDPLHAKKFAAALQNNPGQTNPVLLYVDFESGHGSGRSIEQMIEDIELEWRFVMHNLNMN